MNFNNVLKNKYLYYVAVALMVINVLGYVSLGSIECVLVLGGAAYLANQFTKNRTVDIFIGLFVSNILFGCGRIKEGIDDTLEDGGDKIQKAANKAKKSAAEKAANGDTENAKTQHNIAETLQTVAGAQKHCDKKCQDEKNKKTGKSGFFN